MNENIEFEERMKSLMAEVHSLKSAKAVGLLLTSYSWDSGSTYNWQNRNYKIVFGDGEFPVITHFNSLGTITTFTPTIQGGTMQQIFNFNAGGASTDRIVITSTRPIVSVSAI